MIKINKKEFFEQFAQSDIYGLENLQKQLNKLGNDVFNKMIKNNESNYNDITKDKISIKLCDEQMQIVRANSLLRFTISLNQLFNETVATKYASKYYRKIEDLYYNDVLQDLLNMLNISEEDFDENYN